MAKKPIQLEEYPPMCPPIHAYKPEDCASRAPYIVE